MARLISFSGTVHGVDHERIWSNEEITVPVRDQMVLTEVEVPQTFRVMTFGWGGECSAVYTLTAKLLQNNQVEVITNGLLFEGTNESPGPRDEAQDDKTESIVVPRKGIPVPFKMRLYNDGALGGGGDLADLDLTFTNTLVEEDDEPVPAPAPEPLPLRIRHRKPGDIFLRRHDLEPFPL
jgi:hypothetical protein